MGGAFISLVDPNDFHLLPFRLGFFEYVEPIEKVLDAFEEPGVILAFMVWVFYAMILDL
jgi:hypothetical protein